MFGWYLKALDTMAVRFVSIQIRVHEVIIPISLQR